MRNLKRVLSLGLASSMLVSMLAVSAHAASSFSDADDIVNADAVNTLVALGVIHGKDDGRFDPKGIVTRGEMAKMIAVALNGGTDPKLTGTCDYADAKNHWAAGYIQYCTTLGIVAGDSQGNFNPDNTVTGVEAAKMILVAMGYNAEDEGYINSPSWDTNISIDANTKDLYNNLAVDPTLGLSRDDAAVMIMNGLDAVMVEYDYQLTTVNGQLVSVAIAKDKAGNPTLLSQKFGLSTEYGIMVDASYDEKKEEYTYRFIGAADEDDKISGTIDHTSNFSDLFGQKVKVLLDKKGDAYGMFATDTTVMASGLMGDIDYADIADGYVTIDDKKYDVEVNDWDDMLAWGIYNTNTRGTDTIGSTNFADTDSFVLIDNDDNGDGDVLVVTPYTAGYISYQNKTKVNVRSITGGTTPYEYADHKIDKDLDVDDYVTVIAAANTVDGKAVITGMKAFSETLSAMNKAGTEFTFDGTIYTAYKDGAGFNLEVGEDYDIYAVGTYIWHAERTSEGSTIQDLIYIDALENGSKLSGAAGKAYFMDGTNAIIEIVEFRNADGTVWEKDMVNMDTDTFDGQFYTFNKDDGEYTLTLVGEKNTAGYDGYATAKSDSYLFTEGKSDIGGYEVDDKAVILAVGTDELEYYTGKEALDWNKNFGTEMFVLWDEVDGYQTIMAGVVIDDGRILPGASGDANYGYVTSDPAKVYISAEDEFYWNYNVWTGKGEMEVYEPFFSNRTTVAEAGTVISFEDLGDGFIELVKDVTNQGDYTFAGYGALKGYTSSKISMFHDNTSELYTFTWNDDTTFLYVDSEGKVGMESGSFQLADECYDDVDVEKFLGYYANIMVWSEAGDGKDAQLVVIDVNNRLTDTDGDDILLGLADADDFTVTAPAAGNGFTFALDNATVNTNDKTVSLTVTADETVVAGTLTIKGGTEDVVITIEDGAKTYDAETVTVTGLANVALTAEFVADPVLFDVSTSGEAVTGVTVTPAATVTEGDTEVTVEVVADESAVAGTLTIGGTDVTLTGGVQNENVIVTIEAAAADVVLAVSFVADLG